MNSTRILLTAAAIAAISPLVATGNEKPPTGEPSAVLRQVFSNWQKRQEQVKSFHFRWTDRITLKKGSIDDFRRAERGGILRHEHDQSFESPGAEIWVGSDGRMRYDIHEWFKSGDVTLVGEGILIDRETADGRFRSYFHRFPPCRTFKPPPPAWTRAWVEASSSASIPEPVFVFAFRILRPPSGWSPDECRLITENALLDGVRYVEVERTEKIPRTSRARSTRCWIDPRRDHVIVAWEERQGASTWRTWSGSIEYEKDKIHGWIPARWKLEFTGPQSRLIESTVTSRSINEKYPARLFEPDFPPGTAVRDASTGHHYIIQNDGSKRSITPAELDKLWKVR